MFPSFISTDMKKVTILLFLINARHNVVGNSSVQTSRKNQINGQEPMQ